MAHVTVCPPVRESESFDFHQFGGSKKFHSVHLAFGDLARSHVVRVGHRKPARRLPCPTWALSDAQTREVLVTYLEGRLFVKDRRGSLEERLQRCRGEARVRAFPKRAQLQELIDRYRELLRLPGTEGSVLRRLELQITNLDTDITIAARLPEIVVGVVYLYNRLCWNSVSVGEHLGIRPPHVRQILYRLSRCAKRLESENQNVKTDCSSTRSTRRGRTQLGPCARPMV